VARFRAGGIRFPGIWRVIRETMAAHRPVPAARLADILGADAWAREAAARVMGG